MRFFLEKDSKLDKFLAEEKLAANKGKLAMLNLPSGLAK